ncbi:MAG TPA: nicotinate-nicotinamide nucleotide adenylyltransferase, partial [Gemmatimonadaceae bacterium]
ADVRLAMLQAAVAGNDRFAVEPWELGRQGLSYTVDTLRHLRRALPKAELWLLIGADQWAEFAAWRDPADIQALASIGVLSRAGDDFTAEDAEDAEAQRPLRPPRLNTESEGRVRVVSATRIDISSSEIRRRVGVGESVRYLVPDPVIEIIFREQLYR